MTSAIESADQSREPGQHREPAQGRELAATRVLVARQLDYREHDRLITLLTEDHGRIFVCARAARRSQRRFAVGLSLFVVANAQLRRSGRSGGQIMLEAFDPCEDFTAIANDMVKLAHGSYILELARELWPEHDHDPQLFHLVVTALRVLHRQPASAELLRAFELQLLATLGVAPTFARCGHCSADLCASGCTVDPRGFVLCPDCADVAVTVRQRFAPAEVVAVVRLSSAPLDRLELKLGPDVGPRLRQTTRDLIDRQLSRPLKTRNFLEKLAAMARP